MLTHYPDTAGAVEDAASCTGEMTVPVLHGEWLTGSEMPGPVLPSAGTGDRWLHRAGAAHYAIGKYGADDETPVGTRFDRYV